MRKFLLVLGILFICGIVTAELCIEGLKQTEVLWSMEIFKEYAYAKIAFKNVFWNVMYERIKLILGLLILCITPIRNKVPVILISLFSFCEGFFIMCCIHTLGFAGVFVALGAVLPHGVLYAGIFVLLFQNQRARFYRANENMTRGLTKGFIMILLFVTGCVMECFVSTHFIPWVIRLSLI